MNLQEAFDKVAEHLLLQGKRSENPNICLYRGPDGTKCAIGCLISDEDYTPNMEPKSVEELINSGMLSSELSSFMGENINFFRELQRIHDGIIVYDWKDALKQLAIAYGLEFKGIGT
jgi:hypothetical protein